MWSNKAGRIAVIGDIMLDRYIWGEVDRISPEAPVPVVKVVRQSSTLGGAGNVANNIISLGAEASLYGVVGNDANTYEVMMKAPPGLVLRDDSRPTTTKIRIIAHSQQVARVDIEEIEPLAEELASKLIYGLKKDIFEAIIIADYGKGVVTEFLMTEIHAIAKNRDVILAIDPVVKNRRLYAGATIIAPNAVEFKGMAGIENECDILLLTKGSEGMTLMWNGESIDIPAVAKKVYDVSGAGDTAIATFVVGLVDGMDPIEAATLANKAAGIVVGEVGTATITLERLVE